MKFFYKKKSINSLIQFKGKFGVEKHFPKYKNDVCKEEEGEVHIRMYVYTPLQPTQKSTHACACRCSI